MQSLRVMIVDDSLVALQLAKQAVEALGHKVAMMARNGEEAIAAYSACKPDLTLMDVTMTGMTGIEATTQILKANPEARIVMTTSHAQEKIVKDAMAAGAKGYILKPIKTEKLDRCLGAFAS